MDERTNPFLCFDFEDAAGAAERLCFQDPVEVLIAERLEDVEPCLRAAWAAVQRGLWAAGYLAYEAAPAFDAALAAHPAPSVPLLWLALFRQPVAEPHLPPEEPCEVGAWRPSTGPAAYAAAIGRIREAIAAGETYQMNYTMPLRAPLHGPAFGFYERMRRAQGAGYAAWLDLGPFQIASASPELFFRWDGFRIITRPMKGTARRGRWTEEDKRLAAALRDSPKERAENVMIVDLMRSDLGRLAEHGTVEVTRLFDVETYPTLHQMTSTVAATTRAGTDIVDVFRAAFPCGSVTGAPKAKTMEWIARLEPEPRNVYCGAIGYMRPGGESVFSVAIRTAFIRPAENSVEYGVGGGVTWDSTAEAEHAEAWLKARLLTVQTPEFHLLESLLLADGDYRLLDRHLDRLADSAGYFRYCLDLSRVRAALERTAARHPEGAWKARLTVSRNGDVEAEAVPLADPPAPRRFALAAEPVDSADPFLFHKTTHRAVYDRRRAAHPGVWDVLLWNERDGLTEFTAGNLVLEVGGRRLTPPRACGLLAGTFRAELLARGEIEERVLHRADLERASRIWFINSVRGWLEVFPHGE